MKDYYRILQISEKSSEEDIKQAYRNLAKKYHPDLNQSSDAQQRFTEISEAYEAVLKHVHRFEEVVEEVDTEEILRDIRQAARIQAQRRFEKQEREKKAYHESGLYDIGLLFSYIGRILLLLVSLVLISFPVVVCFSEQSILPFFYLCFLWLLGGFFLFMIYRERQKYFRLGKFYYSLKKVKEILFHTSENSVEDCFYCAGEKANSNPFRLVLLQVKDIQLRNEGPMQHRAGYNRKTITILFPRSQKAYFVHLIVSGVKLFSILFGLLFFPVTSLVWRFLGGLLMGWILTSLLLLITHTQSKTAYLMSYGMIIKIFLWLLVIGSLSEFHFSPLDIQTTPMIHFGIVSYLIVDAILEQFLKIPKKVKLFQPIPKHYVNLTRHFEENCQLYLEIPFWTSLYPLVRWIF